MRPLDDARLARFTAMLSYQVGQYGRAEDFDRLRERLDAAVAERHMPANYLFYCSTPPEQFVDVARNLGRAGLSRPGAAESPWSRIVVEKPFGYDLATARSLDAQIREAFDERQIFRIDHYLGKETVQNLLVLRFANSLFEPIWTQKYVDHVQITVAETLGVGTRGSYYDRTGALRDMVQNHLMNILALVAMEPPSSLHGDAIRNEKVKLLRALRPIPPDCVGYGVVRAQYSAGTIAGETVPGYLDEPGVPADSQTETFVAFKTFIDNWRWSGVPFYLRTGKRLPTTVSEVAIHYRSVPQVLFNAPPQGPMQPNVLVIRIQPDEGISLQFQVKRPGPAMRIAPYRMHFSYADAFEAAPPQAYERLLLDAAAGDATLFLRNDEIDAAWQFVTPILEGCDLQARHKLPSYHAGTWGPEQADRLIAAEGNRWQVFPTQGPVDAE
jgi:glucose-6-phosphate 1-dehydrogenase